ncbi:unnamed protein product [Diatraea saccharalis]|uniref:Uncharacterized protein n=1 Tax=Diatraea saccharalis TaxID=40085 RepID=A0A9N9RAF6_9NEOP|nr:unnamed protein product [Diatraea saccharalis]
MSNISRKHRQSKTRIFDRQNRCINCSFLIPKKLYDKHPVEQAPMHIVTTLRAWIFPTELSPDSIICTECYKLLQKHTNAINEESNMMSEECLPILGHRSICYPCGISISRSARTYSVPHDVKERSILLESVPLHLVSRMERVCVACWMSAYREVKRQHQHDTNHSVPNVESIGDSPDAPVPPPLPPPQSEKVLQQTPKIKSSQYRRAACTSSRCIFQNCSRSERLLIPSAIKELVLYRQKFYIPNGCRVCRYHLNQGHWNELTSELVDFTGEQFDVIMTMMERAANSYLDFSNIKIMSPHLCRYFLGLNSDQFYDLLNSIPNLVDHVPNASIALSVLLVKLKTGDSNERLATLFNKPRSTIERWMGKVKSCLNDDLIKNLLPSSK